MFDWKREAYTSCAQARDRTLEELRKVNLKGGELNQQVNDLEKMMQCNHENMKGASNASAMGGLDMDKCTDCGYEFYY